MKAWMHKFGYTFFSFPKLTLFEICELETMYSEEHKTKKEKDEEDKLNLAKIYIKQKEEEKKNGKT